MLTVVFLILSCLVSLCWMPSVWMSWRHTLSSVYIVKVYRQKHSRFHVVKMPPFLALATLVLMTNLNIILFVFATGKLAKGMVDVMLWRLKMILPKRPLPWVTAILNFCEKFKKSKMKILNRSLNSAKEIKLKSFIDEMNEIEQNWTK